MALIHVVLPKDKFLREIGVDVDWPMHGIPDRVHLHNAKEFHWQALARGVQQRRAAVWDRGRLSG